MEIGILISIMQILILNSGTINQTEIQKITNFGGSVQSTGKFTTDNIDDIVVLSNDSIKIYKGLGNGKIDTIPVYKRYGAAGENTRMILGQVSNYIEPYSIIKTTTSDRDEIIMKQGLQ